MLQEMVIWAIDLPEGISWCCVSKNEERQKNSYFQVVAGLSCVIPWKSWIFLFSTLVWLMFPSSLFSKVWPRQSAARMSECQQQVSLSCGRVWGVVLAAEPSSCPACLCGSKEKCVSGAWMLQFMCVGFFFSGVAGLQPLGRPGSNSVSVDSSRWQQWVGPGPPCGLPLSGTSCVDQQPLLPLCVLRLTYISFLLCTLPGSYKGTSCCP